MTFTPVTVTGTYPGATPAGSSVTFTPLSAMTDGVTTVASAPIVCSLDSLNRIVGPTGQVGVGGVGAVMTATDDPSTSPRGVLYEVMETIVYGGQTRYRSFAGPLSRNVSPIDIATMSPSTTPVPTPPVLAETIRAKAAEALGISGPVDGGSASATYMQVQFIDGGQA